MAYVYILENSDGRHYIGITGLDPAARLTRHNMGHVSSTKNYRPWHIIHTAELQSLQEARDREKQIKSWKGGQAFKKLIYSRSNAD